jgi:NAD(P)-dependent dehydrogenase (short-subunit alcohol dehydrogenase family)
MPDGSVAVIIGVHGGIGSALWHVLSNEYPQVQTVPLGRRTDTPIDLTDEDSIQTAAAHCASLGNVRMVFDATGYLHDEAHQPEKSWRSLSAEGLAKAFVLNAIGPALLMKHFLPLLPRDGKSVFATLSARVGSIGDNQLGGWYGYRASKAALNQLVRSAAIELRRRHPQAVCVALHPGTVDTSLSAPFAKAGLDVQTPAEAAGRLLQVVDGLEARHSGGFFDHHGAPVPW